MYILCAGNVHEKRTKCLKTGKNGEKYHVWTKCPNVDKAGGFDGLKERN